MKKMKNLIKIGIALILLALFTTSCDVVDPVNLDRSVKPTVNLASASMSVTEGSASAITITTEAPANKDMIFKLVQVGGNAVEGVDYTFASNSALDYGPIGGKIVIPAYSTTGTLNIVGIKDIVSDSKSATFELRAIQSMIGVTGGQNQVTVDIKDFLSPYLDMSFSWDTDVVLGGTTYSAAANIDYDIFVSDAAGFDINNPFATANYTGYAATGSEPEVLTMNMSDWPDGEYIIFSDLWENDFFGYGLTQEIPITSTFTRWGAFKKTIVEDSAQAMTLSTNGEYDGSAYTGDAHNSYLAKVTIANGVFTVSTYKGAVVASGKMNKQRTPRPLNLRK